MEQPTPKISIIVPCFNYGHFLSQTLSSVIAQSYENWECVVVDDGSTDNTGSVAEEFCNADHRLRYIRQENRGLSAARNTGIRETTGQFLQFLDADDLIESRKLEVQIRALLEEPSTDLVYTGVRYFYSGNLESSQDSTAERDAHWMPLVSGSGRQLLEELIRGNIFVVNSPLLNRRVVDKCGLFDESLSDHEDWDFWIRAAEAGAHFEYTGSEPGAMALVRTHSESMSASQSRMVESNLRFRLKLNKRLGDSNLRHLNFITMYTIFRHHIGGMRNKARNQVAFRLLGYFLSRMMLRETLVTAYCLVTGKGGLRHETK